MDWSRGNHCLMFINSFSDSVCLIFCPSGYLSSPYHGMCIPTEYTMSQSNGCELNAGWHRAPASVASGLQAMYKALVDRWSTTLGTANTGSKRHRRKGTVQSVRYQIQIWETMKGTHRNAFRKPPGCHRWVPAQMLQPY
jgi:hypothetical protein